MGTDADISPLPSYCTRKFIITFHGSFIYIMKICKLIKTKAFPKYELRKNTTDPQGRQWRKANWLMLKIFVLTFFMLIAFVQCFVQNHEWTTSSVSRHWAWWRCLHASRETKINLHSGTHTYLTDKRKKPRKAGEFSYSAWPWICMMLDTGVITSSAPWANLHVQGSVCLSPMRAFEVMSRQKYQCLYNICRFTKMKIL